MDCREVVIKMPNTPYGFQTLDELLHYTYGRTPEEILKAAGGIGTDTLGVYNPIYGAMIWANFNLEANVFGCLPKYIWDYSGWRIFTEKADQIADASTSTVNNTELGGVVEGGLVPEAIRPIVKEISVRPKTVAYPFQVTEVQEHLANNARDDLWGHLGQQRVYASAQFKELLNRQLLANVANITTEAEDVKARLNLEALDRVVSSKAEKDTFTGAANQKYNPWLNIAGTPPTTADVNEYSDDRVVNTAMIDRTSEIYDTTVTSPSGSLTTSDTLTDGVVRDFLSDIRPAGGKDPTLFIGGHKTYSELQGVYMNSVRIQNPSDLKTTMSVGVNGINTFTGTGVGLHISLVYDIPYIPSKDTPGEKDNPTTGATNGIGNLYALDTSDPEGSGKPRLGIRVLKPIVYYEASHRIPAYPYNTGGFVEKGVFQGMMELTAQQLKTQGKIRDIRRS